MPGLVPAKPELVNTMLGDDRYTVLDNAGVVGCATPTVCRVRSNIDRFRAPESPVQYGGPQKLILPHM